MILRGACHCGDLSLELSTARSPDALVVRACACSHCEQRQALYTADAAGHVRISARDPARVLRYRFALETAEFLSCGRCGCLLAAVTVEAPPRAVINVRCFPAALGFPKAAPAAVWDQEDREARVARRRDGWTPATLEL
ncbi:MAG: hypothetical protein KC636_24010 [Myxococcales bacterium]|nr:hypothetical protein [Myxococcales bacterium]